MSIVPSGASTDIRARTDPQYGFMSRPGGAFVAWSPMPVPTSGPGRLPRALTRFFGRQPETAELVASLERARVVTMTGAPGCGKTRLAIEFAWRSGLRLAAGAESLSRQAGSYINEQFMAPIDRLLEQARREVGASAAERLTAEGARLTLEELATEALADPDRGPDDPLSRREHEVAGLVARGLTNVEIGQELFISKRTVESHVDHVKQKLRLGTRAQLMAWGLDRYATPADQ